MNIQIAQTPQAIHTTKVDVGKADLVMGCDAIVAAHKATLATMQAMAAGAAGQPAPAAAGHDAANPMNAIGNAAMWPWTLMQNAAGHPPGSAAPGGDAPSAGGS